MNQATAEATSANKFSTWKVIQPRIDLKTSYDFCYAFHKAGVTMDSVTARIIDCIIPTISRSDAEVELVILSATQLGYKDDATFREICTRAKEFELDLCQPEFALLLRLQYMDQPKGERLNIAMDPIPHSVSGGLSQFQVSHNDCGYLVDTRWGDFETVWKGQSRFVFCRRK